MRIANNKLLGALPILCALFFLAGVLVGDFRTDNMLTVKYGLTLLDIKFVVALGPLLGLALWRGYRWAWWAGVAAALALLARLSPGLLHYLSGHNNPANGLLVLACLTLLFLIAMLLPTSRAVYAR